MQNSQFNADPNDMVAFLLDENKEKERQIAVLNSVAAKAINENKSLKAQLKSQKKSKKQKGGN